MSDFINKILGLDIYGHKIGVHYNGSDAYKTKVGAFISLGTFVMVAINTFNLITDYTEVVNAQEENFTRRMH